MSKSIYFMNDKELKEYADSFVNMEYCGECFSKYSNCNNKSCVQSLKDSMTNSSNYDFIQSLTEAELGKFLLSINTEDCCTCFVSSDIKDMNLKCDECMKTWLHSKYKRKNKEE